MSRCSTSNEELSTHSDHDDVNHGGSKESVAYQHRYEATLQPAGDARGVGERGHRLPAATRSGWSQRSSSGTEPIKQLACNIRGASPAMAGGVMETISRAALTRVREELQRVARSRGSMVNHTGSTPEEALLVEMEVHAGVHVHAVESATRILGKELDEWAASFDQAKADSCQATAAEWLSSLESLDRCGRVIDGWPRPRFLEICTSVAQSGISLWGEEPVDNLVRLIDGVRMTAEVPLIDPKSNRNNFIELELWMGTLLVATQEATVRVRTLTKRLPAKELEELSVDKRNERMMVLAKEFVSDCVVRSQKEHWQEIFKVSMPHSKFPEGGWWPRARR